MTQERTLLDGNGQRSDICLMRNNQRTNNCSWEMHKDRVFGDGPREHLLWLENHYRGMSHMSCASIWPSRYGACQVLPRFQLAAGVARLRVRFILSARGHGWPRDIARGRECGGLGCVTKQFRLELTRSGPNGGIVKMWSPPMAKTDP